MKVKNIVFSGAMASILMIGIANAEDSVTTTDVTFGGKYNNNTLNVADDVSAISFNYQGTQADGSPTSDIPTSTTGTAENIDKSNFAYTLADGSTTDLAETSTEWTKADYTANTVAGTNEGGNDYSKVHVAEGYGLNANTDVDDGSYSYENPQYDSSVEGSEQYITLDKDGSARSLTSTYSTNETYTSGSIELSSATTAADLISAYSYQTTDEAGTPTSHKYVLSSDGLGVQDLNNDGQAVNLDDPAIDSNLKSALQGMLDAYATDSGQNLTDAKDVLSNLQQAENANFNAAKAVYEADVATQGQLVDNYDTYTIATIALETAQGIDTTKSGEYNTANALLIAAREVYNAPITDTIDTRANDAIAVSLTEEDGAIKVAIAAETTRATEAEETLQTAINNEVTRAQGVEADIRADFAEADAVLDGKITDIKDNQLGEINGLAASLGTNQQRVAENLSGIENATVSDHLTKLATVAADTKDAIANETSRAQGAEATLQNNIDAEATARANADLALQAEINDAAYAAKAADALTLQQANAYTDAQVDTLEKNISGGVAAATALSAVEVSNVKRGEMSVGGGYGYYNGESAGAFGAALGLSDSWSVNAGAGVASGDKTQVAFRAGTNYKFKLF